MDETLPPKPIASKREIKKRARRQFPALVRSMGVRALLFALVLIAVGVVCKPWKWEWLRPDEAVSIAEEFLFSQGVNLERYTLIQAAEYRSNGAWSGVDNDAGFFMNPAVGYVLRYFQEGSDDSWRLNVSPAGQIYEVSRELPEGEPGYELDRDEALELVQKYLGSELGIATLHLDFVSDSLAKLPQRTDWNFVFSSSDFPVSADHLKVRLSGRQITKLSFESSSPIPPQPLRGGAARSRMVEFALIMFGVLQIMIHHRTPLAWKKGVLWGGIAFAIILAVRGLTIQQAALLIPAEGDMRDFLMRVALGGVVEALQGSILVALIVATGEAISRDLLPNITTFTRIGPSHRGWIGSWVQAARWALPAASLILAFEAAMSVFYDPGGLSGRALPIIAGALSSPLQAVTTAALVAKDVLWNEGLYRLWLFPLLIFWIRGPFTAVIVSAGVATYFAGFNVDQMISIGGLQYLLWGIVAAWLTMRVGIFCAMLFHLLVLAGYVGLALLWTGFALTAGILTLLSLMILLIVIALKGEEALHITPSET
ncbi:hypothetical protein KKH18_08715 [bacterium]|nr:hypothetical protein [bacterium]